MLTEKAKNFNPELFFYHDLFSFIAHICRLYIYINGVIYFFNYMYLTDFNYFPMLIKPEINITQLEHVKNDTVERVGY